MFVYSWEILALHESDSNNTSLSCNGATKGLERLLTNQEQLEEFLITKTVQLTDAIHVFSTKTEKTWHMYISSGNVNKENGRESS